MIKLKTLILCFALISTTCLYAQTIAFSGQVTDSLNNPLEYANLLAVPKADQVTVQFGITDQNRTVSNLLS